MRRFSAGGRSLLLVAAAGIALTAGLPAGAASAPPPAPTAGAAPTGAAAAGPRLDLDRDSQTVTSIRGGSAAQFAFEIRNTGSKDLQILTAAPSCGCTVVSFDRTAAPGKSLMVRASVQTQPFWDSFSKSVVLTTNDPLKPTVQLTLIGQVIPIYSVLPATTWNVPYTSADPITRIFIIQSNQKGVLKILPPPTTNGPITAHVEQDPNNPDAWRVTAALTPPPARGDVTGEIDLNTNLPSIPPIRLFLAGIGDDGITTWPQTASFTAVSIPGMAPHVEMALCSTKSHFHITGAQSDDPALKLTYQEQPRNISWYSLVVTYAGGWAPGKHTGKLTISTDLPALPSFQIPYAVVVR